MIIFKLILSILIIFCSARIGIEISKKYIQREKELYEIKNAFKIMETKIRYTYKPLKEIFEEISTTVDTSVANIFKNASKHIEFKSAKSTWENAIDNTNLFLNKEDIEIIKGFGKLLGKTDKLGQLSEIELVVSLIDKQIGQATAEREKNENLYKKIGFILGIGLVIILV